jgi:hypothetical protein
MPMEYKGKFIAARDGQVYIDLPALYQVQEKLGISHKGYGEYLTAKPVEISGFGPAKLVISRLYNNVLLRKVMDSGLQDRAYEVTLAGNEAPASSVAECFRDVIGISPVMLKENKQLVITIADLLGDEFGRVRNLQEMKAIKTLIITESKYRRKNKDNTFSLIFEDGSTLTMHDKHLTF